MEISIHTMGRAFMTAIAQLGLQFQKQGKASTSAHTEPLRSQLLVLGGYLEVETIVYHSQIASSLSPFGSSFGQGESAN